MCGIIGIVEKNNSSKEWELRLKQMAESLYHRGPDDEGIWIDPDAGIGLAHRRLAIIDITEEGHQPMISASGKYVITFNGEIYNFKKLREELERMGCCFRGSSDVEVALAAIEAWGLEEAVEHFIGMFAFALWDRSERTLCLVRDRLGIKPLYYGMLGDAFMFASELKTFRKHPKFSGEINRDALSLFLRHNYVPTPYSIYQGINKLSSGCILKVFCTDGADASRPHIPEPYWSMDRVVQTAVRNPFRGSDDDAIQEFEELLRDSIRLRMIADVPLGAFLSGGIDSTSVVAMMQSESTRPIQTFTIGYWEQQYNEARFAKEIAAHLETDHTELYVTPEDALGVISRLPILFDEPFADSSQIPTFLVSQLARGNVTVCLSGDGGDELFGGYDRYFWGANVWKITNRSPRRIKEVLSRYVHRFNFKWLDSIVDNFRSSLKTTSLDSRLSDKIPKFVEMLQADNVSEMYRVLISHWNQPEKVVIGSKEMTDYYMKGTAWEKLESVFHKMMYFDVTNYLPDNNLTKMDRASMGVSLEARVPLLDHRIVSFAWRLPLHMKIRNGKGKWILRKLLNRYVPEQLVERPKMGFGVPIDFWLRGPLREWAEELLNESRIRKENYFNPEPIRTMWEEHLSGERNWQYYLWDILMFQMWLEKQHSH